MPTQTSALIETKAPSGASWYDLGHYTTETLDRRIEAAAAGHLDHPMIFSAGEGVVETTIGNLLRDAEAVSAGLWSRGIRADDRIAICLPNWREALLLYLGALRIGAVCVPIVPTFGDTETRFILQDSGARLLFCPDNFRGRDYAAQCRAYLSEGLIDNLVLVDPLHNSEGANIWQDFVKTERRSEPQRADDPDALAFVIYTSGTTSSPKGARHTHNSLGAEITSEAYTKAEHGFTLNIWPITHIAGLLQSIEPFFIPGGGYSTDVWNPEGAAKLIAQRKVKRTSATPFHLRQLLDAAEEHGIDLSSFWAFRTGAMPVPSALVKRAANHGFKVCRSYGSSECPTFSLNWPDDPAEKLAHTEGRPIPGGYVATLGEDGSINDASVEGELLLRSPEMFKGYTDPALNDCFVEGWFRTGDIGRLDEHGYLVLTDRSKDIVNRGGEKISSLEVEELLSVMPAISEVAVVPSPHDLLGEVVCAVVTLRPERQLTIAEIREHFTKQGVANQKMPERLVIITEFPRTSVGKILKKQLKSYVWGEHADVAPISDEIAHSRAQARSD